MGVTLKYIGQAAMDGFFQNFRDNSSFFILNDFIFRAATIIADFYQKSYDAQYAMNRADKTDEVISFSSDILSEQDLKVERKNQEVFAKLQYPIMAFIHDKQTTGAQELIATNPYNAQLERSNITETWQYKLLPLTNRIFWRMQGERILFFKNGFANINEVKLLYVPAVMDRNGKVLDDTLIADGVAEMAINTTIMKMKAEKDGVVIKELNDGQSNKILQNEANLVKP
jgi:hypothetical protein